MGSWQGMQPLLLPPWAALLSSSRYHPQVGQVSSHFYIYILTLVSRLSETSGISHKSHLWLIPLVPFSLKLVYRCKMRYKLFFSFYQVLVVVTLLNVWVLFFLACVSLHCKLVSPVLTVLVLLRALLIVLKKIQTNLKFTKNKEDHTLHSERTGMID
jgi:hypothetical protein